MAGQVTTQSGLPTLAEALLLAIEARLIDVHTTRIGIVHSYDATSQTCSAQPMHQRGYRDEDGDRVVETLPVIQHVPVAWFGAGSSAITCDLAVGDLVLLLFSETSIDRGLGRGVHDTSDDRTHSLNDAIAVPCLRASALFPPPVSGALAVRAPKVHLGDPTVPIIEAPGPLNDGVVTGQGIDSFTGVPYSLLGSASTKVFAKKS